MEDDKANKVENVKVLHISAALWENEGRNNPTNCVKVDEDVCTCLLRVYFKNSKKFFEKKQWVKDLTGITNLSYYIW